jgi:hypothetical protein
MLQEGQDGSLVGVIDENSATYHGKNSGSVRTTIPSVVAKAMQVKSGDYLHWRIEYHNKGVIVKVSKEQ